MTFIVLCCVGRGFEDDCKIYDALNALLSHAKGPMAIVHGGARGADSVSGKWARLNGIPEIVVSAPWDKYGNSAGTIRNQWMLDFCNPSYCVAFPGGRGTADMVRRCRKAGLQVWEPYA